MDRQQKRQLAVVAVALLDALLTFPQPPHQAALYGRMRSVRPGDLVMEISTIRWLLRWDPYLSDDRWDGQLVPFLRKEQRTQLATEEGDAPWSETALICRNPDGTEFAWTNAECVAIPTLDWSSDAASGGAGRVPEGTEAASRS